LAQVVRSRPRPLSLLERSPAPPSEMLPPLALLLALAVASPASASRLVARGKAHAAGSFLRAGMRPEIVARSLVKVEDEWRSQFRLYVECNATASSRADAEKCEAAPRAFEHACGTIVSAVVQASSGDHRVVREYMDDICSQPELKGWRAGRCQLLSASVLAGMTEDNYDNREHLNAAPLCQSFWARFSTEEHDLIRQEAAGREAEEKRLEEEHAQEAKAAAEQAAEEEKKRREEEEVQAKQRAAEEEDEAVRRQEAEKEELKRQAEASALKLQAMREAASNATAENQVVARNATEAVVANTTGNASAQNASQNVVAANTTEH